MMLLLKKKTTVQGSLWGTEDCRQSVSMNGGRKIVGVGDKIERSQTSSSIELQTGPMESALFAAAAHRLPAGGGNAAECAAVRGKGGD